MMPRMPRRVLNRLLLLIIVAAAGFLLLFWGMAPGNFTSLERFALLRGGETEEEVEQLFGAPGIDKHLPPRALDGKVDPGDVSLSKEWRTHDGQRIVVCFDKSGKHVASARFEDSDNWLDKLRRWLRRSS